MDTTENQRHKFWKDVEQGCYTYLMTDGNNIPKLVALKPGENLDLDDDSVMNYVPEDYSLHLEGELQLTTHGTTTLITVGDVGIIRVYLGKIRGDSAHILPAVAPNGSQYTVEFLIPESAMDFGSFNLEANKRTVVNAFLAIYIKAIERSGKCLH